MFIISLGIILLILGVLERILCRKKNKIPEKSIVFLRVVIVSLLFFISYLITDTAIGTFYVFSLFCTYILFSNWGFMDYPSLRKHLIFILFPPLIGFLLVQYFQNILVSPGYGIVLMLFLNLIYYNRQKMDNTKKQDISLAVGIIIMLSIIFFHYNPYDMDKKMVLDKHEKIAYRFLVEELGLSGVTVYSFPGFDTIRGKELEIYGIDESSDYHIKMVYKNNRIIRYEEY